MATGVVFFDGFEIDRNLQNYILSQGITVNAAYARYGGAGARFSHNAPFLAIAVPSPVASIIGGFAIKPILGFDAFQCDLFGAYEAGARHAKVLINGSNQLAIVGAAGTVLATGTSPIIDEAWQYVEVKIVVHDTAGSVEVRMNGSLVVAAYNVDTRAAGTTGVAEMLIVGHTAVSTDSFQANFDDMYVADASIGDFLGDVIIRQLTPITDDTVAFGRSAETTNVENIDEVPISAADYIHTAAGGVRDLYGLADSPYDAASGYTPIAVRHVFAHQKTDQVTRKVRGIVRDGASEHLGATQYSGYGGLQVRQQVWDERPGGAGIWTIASLDSLKAGVETVA